MLLFVGAMPAATVRPQSPVVATGIHVSREPKWRRVPGDARCVVCGARPSTDGFAEVVVLYAGTPQKCRHFFVGGTGPLTSVLDDLKNEVVRETLERAGGQAKRAAKLVAISIRVFAVWRDVQAGKNQL